MNFLGNDGTLEAAQRIDLSARADAATAPDAETKPHDSVRIFVGSGAESAAAGLRPAARRP
jgi:hypothetical protein